MPAYDAPLGAPIWFDLMTSDAERSVAFYSALFGWEADEANAEFGGYRNFRLGGEIIAGLMQSTPGDGPADVWSVYLHVADAADALDRASAAGAKDIVVPAMPVGDLGHFGMLIDAAGAAVGVWQPGTHRGFATKGEPGTPYWFDTLSQDYEASLAFYRDAFGLSANEIGAGSDAPGPDRYSELSADGGDSFAGVMDARGLFGDGHPSFWQVYITVADANASAAKAVELGGTILNGPEPTPWGTLCSVRDPLGAVILIATPPEGM